MSIFLGTRALFSRVLESTALNAAATTNYSTPVDMTGYRGCAFIAVTGAATSASQITMYIRGGATTGALTGLSGTTAASTAGGSGVLIAEGCIVSEYTLPSTGNRYLQAAVIRSSGIELDGVLAIQTGPRDLLVTQSSDQGCFDYEHEAGA